MSDQALWKANGTLPLAEAGALFERFAGGALELGLLGDARWLRADADAEEQPVTLPAGPDLPARLREKAAVREGAVDLSAGGEGWRLAWSALPTDPAEPGGPCLYTLWLTFLRTRVPDRRASDALLSAFYAMHQPEETSYAVIHPFEHWLTFSDEHYPEPITTATYFRGVYWANFLGKRQLAALDRAALAGLRAHEVRWAGQDGLFFVTAPDLAAADGPEAEREMLRLYAWFLRARR